MYILILIFLLFIVHPERFRSNVQIAIAFARRNRPRVHRNNEFACVYLRLRAFASTDRDRLCARTYVRARRELHLVCVFFLFFLKNIYNI